MMSPARTYRTVCPRNCYCTCGMLVTVEEGRITGIEGDPLNSATMGKVCLKGISYARRIATEDRLLRPLRRRGKSDGFEAVDWDDALDDISARLSRLRRDSGPQSVFYYEGSGSHGGLSMMADAFWHQFGGPTRAHGDLCWPAGLEATRLTYGANFHNHPRLTRESRFILLWGHNPAETNIHQMRLILDAQESGATLAAVDPRSTDTTDAADIHIRPRPGTDAALAMGIAHEIVTAGLHDARYLEEHAFGYQAYIERLGEFPLDRVARICGLDPVEIGTLAHSYAGIRPALLIAGFGLQRHSQAGQTMRAVALLPALTCNVGIAGGGFQYANLASHRLRSPSLSVKMPDRTRSIPTARFGAALLELRDPPIRAAWIEKANPASQHPRTGNVLQALEALDLLVVVDQRMSDTARLAHYVLPAKSMFEEDDLVTAYWHPYLQLRRKILESPGQVKTDTEIWRLLCLRSGFDTRDFLPDSHAMLVRLLPEGGMDLLSKLEQGPVDMSETGDVAWHDHKFKTPSGKIEFQSAEAARLWGVDPLPGYIPLAEGHDSQASRRFPLQLLTCKTRERIHSQFGNVDWVRGIERRRCLDIHPEDARSRRLDDGCSARIWNDRGDARVEIRLNPGIRPGVVHVIEGRCVDSDPEMNRLTSDGATDMNHGAVFYECLVEVERA